MRETTDNSDDFAATRVRGSAGVAIAFQTPRGPPEQGKTDRTDPIACGHDGWIAALCQRRFGLIRRACRMGFHVR